MSYIILIYLAGLPGLSSYLDELIRNCILWYMVHPNKVVPPHMAHLQSLRQPSRWFCR